MCAHFCNAPLQIVRLFDYNGVILLHRKQSPSLLHWTNHCLLVLRPPAWCHNVLGNAPVGHTMFKLERINYNHKNRHYIETTVYTMFRQCFLNYRTADNHMKTEEYSITLIIIIWCAYYSLLIPIWQKGDTAGAALNSMRTSIWLQLIRISRFRHLKPFGECFTSSFVSAICSYGYPWSPES